MFVATLKILCRGLIYHARGFLRSYKFISDPLPILNTPRRENPLALIFVLLNVFLNSLVHTLESFLRSFSSH